MIQYAKDLDKAKNGIGGFPDRQMLTEARKHLDKVLSVRPCLRIHLEMAQVNYGHEAKNPQQEQCFKNSTFPFRFTTTWA